MPAQVLDWKALVEVILGPSMGNDFGTKTYQELERKGMPGDITFVQQVAMPPNAWTGDKGDGLVADLNVEFTDKALETAWNERGTMALPIAFYSTTNTSGWMMNKEVEKLSVTVSKEPSFLYKRSDHRNDDHESVTTTIQLPVDPTILEVTASSSGAGGYVASPKLLRAQGYLSFLGERFAHWLTRCSSRTLVDLSVPQRNMVDTTQHQHGTTSPTYRFIDGGFVENTALASTIGKVHADNPDDTYLGRFIHFDLDKPFENLKEGELENRVAALFSQASPEDIPCLGADQNQLCTNNKGRGQKNAQNIGRPVSTIFKDFWPAEEHQWEVYATHTETFAYTCLNKCETTKSYYWKGTMTTIENKWYGVPAGLKLDLLIFAYNEPTSTIFVGDNRVTPVGLKPVGGPGVWEMMYGPIAQEQADGAQPVIEEFLDRGIPSGDRRIP